MSGLLDDPEMARLIGRAHRGCAGKRGHYKSKADAKKHARIVRRRGGTWLEPYHCGICGEWHLTTRRRR